MMNQTILFARERADEISGVLEILRQQATALVERSQMLESRARGLAAFRERAALEDGEVESVNNLAAMCADQARLLVRAAGRLYCYREVRHGG